MTEHDATHSALRKWAAGDYPKEAAVELLIRALGGRLASPGCLWIDTDGKESWIDASAIALDVAEVDATELALLEVVSSLLHGGPVDLYDIVTRPGRAELALILAALSHAGDWRREGASIFPWPADNTESTVQ